MMTGGTSIPGNHVGKIEGGIDMLMFEEFWTHSYCEYFDGQLKFSWEAWKRLENRVFVCHLLTDRSWSIDPSTIIFLGIIHPKKP